MDINLSILHQFCFMHTHIFPPCREIFPEGLPPSYVFVATVRLKGSSRGEKVDLWRVVSKDRATQAMVTLNGQDKSVTFTTTSTTDLEQRVTFSVPILEVGIIDTGCGPWMVLPQQFEYQAFSIHKNMQCAALSESQEC